MLSRYDVSNALLPMWGIPTNAGTNTHSMMNRLFEDFETAFHRSTSNLRRARRLADRPAAYYQNALPAGSPRAQLRDTGSAVSMLVDLPGLSLEDIELSIEDTTVRLRTAAAAPKLPEGFELVRRERAHRGVEWSFALPYPIDAGAASATLRHGRLEVTLPKAPEAKPIRIPVQGLESERS